jgi:hypothetical protein
MQQPAVYPNTPSRAEAEIEAQLGLMTAAIARCFERSEGEDHTVFQNLRSEEVGHAARLISLSAEMGQALAKLRGKFEHEIKVVRAPDARSEANRALSQVIEAEALPTPSPRK